MRWPLPVVWLVICGVLVLAGPTARAQEPNPANPAPVGVPEGAGEAPSGGDSSARGGEPTATPTAGTEPSAGAPSPEAAAAPPEATPPPEEAALEEDGAREARDTGEPDEARDTGTPAEPGGEAPAPLAPQLDVVEGVPDLLTVPPEAAVTEPPPPREAARGGSTAGAAAPVEVTVPSPATAVLDSLSRGMLTRHGPLQSLRLGLLALVFLLLSLVLERQRRRLADEGLLPGVLGSLAVICRGAFVPLVLLSLFALTPRSWGWVEPLVVVVIAIAAGWASREILGDVFAGMVLTVERPFREGQRVRIGEIEGEVTRQGLRLTWLRTDDGRVVAVPNRSVTALGWSIEPDAFAPIRVRLYVDPDLPARAVREVLEEATLASPWLATQHSPVVYRAPEELHLWIIEGRLVHPRYAGAFKGSLVELSEGRLAELAEAREGGAGER